MDLEWLEESTEYEKDQDDNEIPKSLLNDYQKTEEIIVSIYENIRDYLHKENERFLLIDMEMSDVAEWIYDPSYIEYVKKTEEGSKLF